MVFKLEVVTLDSEVYIPHNPANKKNDTPAALAATGVLRHWLPLVYGGGDLLETRAPVRAKKGASRRVGAS